MSVGFDMSADLFGPSATGPTIGQKAGKHIHDNVKIVVSIIDGADVTTKLTKLVNATILLVTQIFKLVATGWRNLSATLSGFHDLVDFMMTPVVISDMFKLVKGEVKGALAKASTIALSVWRVLMCVKLLNVFKIINVGALTRTIGCIPVFGTVLNAVSIASISLDAAVQMQTLRSQEFKVKTAERVLHGAYYDTVKVNLASSNFAERIKQFTNQVMNNSLLTLVELQALKDVNSEEGAEDLAKRFGALLKTIATRLVPFQQIEEKNPSNVKDAATFVKIVKMVQKLTILPDDLKKELDAVNFNDAPEAIETKLSGFRDRLLAVAFKVKASVKDISIDLHQLAADAKLLSSGDLVAKTQKVFSDALETRLLLTNMSEKEREDYKDSISKKIKNLTGTDYTRHHVKEAARFHTEDGLIAVAERTSKILAFADRISKILLVATATLLSFGLTVFAGVPLFTILFISSGIAFARLYHDKVHGAGTKPEAIKKHPKNAELEKFAEENRGAKGHLENSIKELKLIDEAYKELISFKA